MMAHSFWDDLMLITALEIRDYFRDKNDQQKKREKIYKQLGKEISRDALKLFDVICDEATKVKPNGLPKEIVEGGLRLSLYAFLMVVKAQGGKLTSEQDQLITLFLERISGEISKAEFLAAGRGISECQKLERLVGISETQAGAFWTTFFKILRMSDSEEKALRKVTERFTSIVMKFAILGDPQSEAAVSVCERFIQSIHIQMDRCSQMPEDEVDSLGEVPPREYYKRMKEQAIDISTAAGDESEIEPMLMYFTIGLLYELVNNSSGSRAEKAAMLDKCLKLSEINAGLTGDEIIQSIESKDTLYNVLDTLVQIRPGQYSFLGIIRSLASKADRDEDALTFAKGCASYLIGVEIALSKAYPNRGFGSLANRIMADLVSKLLKFG